MAGQMPKVDDGGDGTNLGDDDYVPWRWMGNDNGDGDGGDGGPTLDGLDLPIISWMITGGTPFVNGNRQMGMVTMDLEVFSCSGDGIVMICYDIT